MFGGVATVKSGHLIVLPASSALTHRITLNKYFIHPQEELSVCVWGGGGSSI